MNNEDTLYCTVTTTDGYAIQSNTRTFWNKKSDRMLCFSFNFTDENALMRRSPDMNQEACETTSDLDTVDRMRIDLREISNMSLSFSGMQILSVGSSFDKLSHVDDHYEILTKGAHAIVKMHVESDGYLLKDLIVEADSAEMSCVLFNTKTRKTPPDLSGLVISGKKRSTRRKIDK